MQDSRGLLNELVRRRVLPAAIYYVGIAWLILQVADVAAEAWGLSARSLQFVWVALAIGFPFALVISWKYDITRAGFKATGPLMPSDSGGAAFASLISRLAGDDEPNHADDVSCWNCDTWNRGDAEFCLQCGAALRHRCSRCQSMVGADLSSCATCGAELEPLAQVAAPNIRWQTKPASEDDDHAERPRKSPVCVLAVRLRDAVFRSSEDDELAAELLGEFADQLSHIAEKHSGRIEEITDGSVSVVFGVPQAREHDALCAVNAALAIRSLTQAGFSGADTEQRVTTLPSIGITTGFVYSGMSKKTSVPTNTIGGVTSRARQIADCAAAGEILVAADVFERTQGFFDFGPVRQTSTSAASNAAQLRPALREKTDSSAVHRVSGRRAPLVGRIKELAQLEEAVRNLKSGQGSFTAIVGPAGTGKSRLMRELRNQLMPDNFRYLEGHSFSHTQNIPYFPIRDLLDNLWDLKGLESPASIRSAVEKGATDLLGSGSSMVEYICGLYGFVDEQEVGDNPEVRNTRLRRSILALLSSLSIRQPTVIFIEDLHWADTASIELIRFITSEIRSPTMFVCTHRQYFSLFDTIHRRSLGDRLAVINLRDLSTSEAAEMMDLLLDNRPVPKAFLKFVTTEAEGNPFFIEEVVNSAVESGVLVQHEDGWQISGRLADFKIPTTIDGVISDRFGRVSSRSRCVLQEASVLGRTFSKQLLADVSRVSSGIDQCIDDVQRLGMVNISFDRGAEVYSFNHVMTQEVVYQSMLRKERREIHERVAEAIEKRFSDRLPDYCEVLAFHFKNGLSTSKAVDYLMAAGDKSWRHYSLGEARKHYEDAYELLVNDSNSDNSDRILDVIDRWGIVFNHEGDYKRLMRLLDRNEDIAEAAAEKHPALVAMYYGWRGYALQCAERLDESYQCLEHALALARTSGCNKTIAYISSFQARTCTDMGRLDEAEFYGKESWKIAETLEQDSKLFRFIWSALGLCYYFKGDCENSNAVADLLKDYAESRSDVRSMLLAHVNRGCFHLISGSNELAVREFARGASVAVDPMYGMYARLMLGIALASSSRLKEAEQVLTEVLNYDRDHGFETLGTTAKGMMSVVLLSRGELSEGVELAEHVLGKYRANGNMFRYAHQEHMLGTFYSRLLLREGAASLSYLARNAAFFVKNMRHARRRAELHFHNACRIAESIGAKIVSGQAKLGLARVHAHAGVMDEAKSALREAEQIFETCRAVDFLAVTRQEIDRLSTGSGITASA